MLHHKQLLDQANRLAHSPVGPSQQADLRRAVSSAYYALFHFLIAVTCRYLLGGARQDQAMRAILGRAFAHNEMTKASMSFKGGTLPALMDKHLGKVPKPLQEIAGTFTRIIESRQRADYDLTPGSDFSPAEVAEIIREVERAMRAWATVRTQPIARFYLVSLLSWDKMKDKRSV